MTRHKTRALALTFCLLLACTDENPRGTSQDAGTEMMTQITRIEITPALDSLVEGERHSLRAVAKDADGQVVEDVSFSWSSSDADVASVTDGMVTALHVGSTDIHASADGVESEPLELTVVESMAPGFELVLSEEKLPILQGTSSRVGVTVKRKHGFAGAVTIQGTGLPTGVTLDALTVAENDSEGSLVLHAAASAPHTLPLEVTFEGTSGSLHDERHATLTVMGPPGSVDTSFAGGKVIQPVGAAEDYARAMAVQADGKILVAGQSSENAGDIALLRLTRDGELDLSFGDGGHRLTAVGSGSDSAYALAVQADGKIVVAGSSWVEGKGLDFVVVRYTEQGALDPSFGVGGKVTTSFTDDSDTAYAIALQGDGKIVVGGEANRGTAASGVDFALARYQPDGALDESFGDHGKVMTSMAAFTARDTIYALGLQEVQGETRILAAGGEGDFKLARYRADGTLDVAFGTAGKVIGPFGSVTGAARALELDAAGKIVVAGHSQNHFAMVRLAADGEPDGGFGEEGKVVTEISAGNWDQAQGLALQESGEILLGGWAYEGNSTSGNFALARYHASGVLDGSFGNAGIVITEVAAPQKRDEAHALVLQVDARVPTVRALLGGSANGANNDFAVTRHWL